MLSIALSTWPFLSMAERGLWVTSDGGRLLRTINTVLSEIKAQNLLPQNSSLLNFSQQEILPYGRGGEAGDIYTGQAVWKLT